MFQSHAVAVRRRSVPSKIAMLPAGTQLQAIYTFGNHAAFFADTVREATPAELVGSGTANTDEPRPHIVFLAHWDKALYLFRRPLMKALVERGWHVSALTPRGDYTDRWKADGIEAVCYEISRRSTNPIQEIPVILNLYRIFRRLSPDIVHTFTAKPNIYGTLAAHRAHVPVIVNTITGLGSFFVERGRPGVGQKVLTALYRFSGNYTDAVTFQNREDEQFFAERHLLPPGKQTELIRGSGVNLDQYSPQNFTEQDRADLRNSLGIPDHAIVVTLIARLIWDKGIREFCDAARVIRAEYGDRVVFLSVGDYYEGNPSCVPKEYMQEVVNSKTILAAGWREDIPALLNASEIITLPSFLKEGIPHSLQQACAMGKPIVTTHNTGCREIVDEGVNGFLVPVHDSKALADALRIMIDDPRLREDMGKKSRKKAEKEFDIRQNIADHLELYTSLLHKNRKR